MKLSQLLVLQSLLQRNIHTARHKLLNPTDTFKFKCTQCGECCKRPANSVILDTYDVYNIRTHQHNTYTYNIYQQYRYAFKFDIALLQLDNTSSKRLQLPIVSLQINKQSKNCYFSYTAEQYNIDNSSNNNNHNNHGLRCKLGKEYMPLQCALYPLGLNDQQQYILNTVDCEGINATAKQYSVNQYVQNNLIDNRLQQWQWYCKLVNHVITQISELKLPLKVKEYVYEILTGILYDFDALDILHSNDTLRLHTFNDVKQHVENCCRTLLNITKHLNELSMPPREQRRLIQQRSTTVGLTRSIIYLI